MPYTPQRPLRAPRSKKTAFDIVCGPIFIVFGLVALGYFVYSGYMFASYISRITISWTYLSSFLTDLFAYLFGVICGIFLIIAGASSLNSGKGAPAGYLGFAFLALVIVCHIVSIITAYASGYVPSGYPLLEYIRGSLIVYAIQIFALITLIVLLPIKNSLKKKARSR
jgi:hypothetical protein